MWGIGIGLVERFRVRILGHVFNDPMTQRDLAEPSGTMTQCDPAKFNDPSDPMTQRDPVTQHDPVIQSCN